MDFLSQLWLPIVVASGLVFVVSALIHMATPVHKSDHRALPNEARTLEALRVNGVGPGDYAFPYCGSKKDMGSPEMLARYQQGPIGFLTVLPGGMPSIGKALVLWFLFTLVVGTLTAYAAWHALGAGADYPTVFRVTGVIAWLGYGVSTVDQSIWKGRPWGTTFKFVCDGLLYGLVTGGAFGWLWPAVTG